MPRVSSVAEITPHCGLQVRSVAIAHRMRCSNDRRAALGQMRLEDLQSQLIKIWWRTLGWWTQQAGSAQPGGRPLPDRRSLL
jgi:hypothetical protein